MKLKECTLTSNEVVWLLEILDEFTPAERKQFMWFVTGRKRIRKSRFA